MNDNRISISAYARSRSISIQAVSQQIKRPAYSKLWDAGHIRKEGHSISLDETAVAALDEGRPAKVVVERAQQNEEMERLRSKNMELLEMMNALKDRIIELQDERKLLTDQTLQIQSMSGQIDNMTLKISALNSQVDAKEQERAKLSDRLEAVEKDAEKLSERLEVAEGEKKALSDQLTEAQTTAAIAELARQEITEDLQKEQERASAEKSRMEQEIEELRSRLETEKKKTWWQKLWGK